MADAEDYEDDFEEYDDDDFEEYDEEEDVSPRHEAAAAAARGGVKGKGRQSPLSSPMTPAATRPVSKTSPLSAAKPKSHRRLVLSKGSGATRNKEEQEAKKKRGAIHRMKKWKTLTTGKTERGKALTDMAQCDLGCLFAMEPLSVLELYARGLGKFAKLSRAAMQTNEDACSVSIQTEEIENSSVTVQVPDDLGVSMVTVQARDEGGSSKRRAKLQNSTTASLRVLQEDLDNKLKAMLARTLPLVFQGIRENMPPQRSTFSGISRANGGSSSSSSSATGSVSAASMTLVSSGTIAAQANLDKRKIVCVAFARNGRELMIAYSETPVEVRGALGMVEEGIIAVWTLSTSYGDGKQNERMKSLLVCQSAITCAAWGADGRSTIVAGLANGGVAVWDLTEHIHSESSAEPFVHRSSATSEYSPDDVGEASISAISCMTMEVDDESEKRSNANGPPPPSSSFAVVTVDEFGRTASWTVSKLSSTSMRGAAEGTRVGSRVSLLRVAAQLKLGDGSSSGSAGLASCIAGIPERNVQFIVGFSSGLLMRGSRFGRAPTPRMWTSNVMDVLDMAEEARRDGVQSNRLLNTPSAVGVCAVSFSPFVPELMAVGYSTGAVSMYSIYESEPLLQIPHVLDGIGVTSLHWSPISPSLLMVMDQASVLRTFNFLSGSEKPISSECFSGDTLDVVGVSVTEPAHNEADHLMVLCYSDGGADIHLLNSDAPQNLQGAIDDMRSKFGQLGTWELLA